MAIATGPVATAIENASNAKDGFQEIFRQLNTSEGTKEVKNHPDNGLVEKVLANADLRASAGNAKTVIGFLVQNGTNYGASIAGMPFDDFVSANCSKDLAAFIQTDLAKLKPAARITPVPNPNPQVHSAGAPSATMFASAGQSTPNQHKRNRIARSPDGSTDDILPDTKKPVKATGAGYEKSAGSTPVFTPHNSIVTY